MRQKNTTEDGISKNERIFISIIKTLKSTNKLSPLPSSISLLLSESKLPDSTQLAGKRRLCSPEKLFQVFLLLLFLILLFLISISI
jgi:hypothetical protein